MNIAEFEETDIGKALYEAHRQSACRHNPSFLAFINAYQHNGQCLDKAITCGMATLGGTHAPILETRWFFDHLLNIHIHEGYDYVKSELIEMLNQGRKIPGFGYGFNNGKPEQCWIESHNQSIMIHANDSCIANITLNIENSLHNLGKTIYANPSWYTCLAASSLGVHPKLTEALFLKPRIQAWIDYVASYYEPSSEGQEVTPD